MPSTRLLFFASTEIVTVAEPAAKVAVLEIGAKSKPLRAVPPRVIFTVNATVRSPARVKVN